MKCTCSFVSKLPISVLVENDDTCLKIKNNYTVVFEIKMYARTIPVTRLHTKIPNKIGSKFEKNVATPVKHQFFEINPLFELEKVWRSVVLFSESFNFLKIQF
jgi:hypothetical protein